MQSKLKQEVVVINNIESQKEFLKSKLTNQPNAFEKRQSKKKRIEKS